MKKRMKGFTLIELIAVLVIMAIIALIVTPLVMSIIRKARVSADKRSIDAYGRSIELAIAGYLLDNGKFPTDISQLTIEYSGNEVVCETTQINTDSSLYLAGCTVDGRNVDGYTYGSEEIVTYDAYQVGDYVSYNNITYYVIEESDTTNDTVKLLKENPLTKTEMDGLNLTGITISESRGYGQVQYGSSTDYSTSTVKQVVDAWKNTAVKSSDTAIARLINIDEVTVLGYTYINNDTSGGVNMIWRVTDDVPHWVYGTDDVYGGWGYWTMSQFNDSSRLWYIVNIDGRLRDSEKSELKNVRPVLELNKSADITKLSS